MCSWLFWRRRPAGNGASSTRRISPTEASRTSTTGTYKVQWCPDGATIRADSFCTGQGNSLQFNYDTTDPVIWVYVGTQNCTQVKLDFDYSQYSANLTATVLRYKLSTDTVKTCPSSSSGYTAAQNLNLANCNHVSYTVNVAGNKSVYFMFDHGTPSNTMITIDNIVVSTVGLRVRPGAERA